MLNAMLVILIVAILYTFNNLPTYLVAKLIAHDPSWRYFRRH